MIKKLRRVLALIAVGLIGGATVAGATSLSQPNDPQFYFDNFSALSGKEYAV